MNQAIVTTVVKMHCLTGLTSIVEVLYHLPYAYISFTLIIINIYIVLFLEVKRYIQIGQCVNMILLYAHNAYLICSHGRWIYISQYTITVSN